MASENWTVGRLIDWTTEYFTSAGIPEARIDAEVLLSHALDCPRLELHFKRDEQVGKEALGTFKELVIERRKRKPVSYILGHREFMGLRFKVNGATLIPRPETELLVEEVQRLIKGKDASVLLELGTGSGNIAVTLAKFTGIRKIYSCDISLEALRVAQENINDNGVSAKVTLTQGDLFEAFKGEHLEEGGADIIVSNPPYVALAEKGELLPEIFFEPETALFGGYEGLDFYKRIMKDAGKFLKKNGSIVFEMNAARSQAIRNIVLGAGFKVDKVVKDYSGMERIIIGSIQK